MAAPVAPNRRPEASLAIVVPALQRRTVQHGRIPSPGLAHGSPQGAQTCAIRAG